MPTVTIETHGCKLNQADSQALARKFTDAGYQLVDSSQQADVYVLDTCTVTQVSDSKARSALRAARRQSPKALIVATGCYAERDPRALETIQEVDLVLGNSDKDSLIQKILSIQVGMLSPYPTGKEMAVYTDMKAPEGTHRTRAMVKIQEGCNQVCAYCIVPKVRGRERSIPADNLVSQILALEDEGYQEVVLTGTQLISYGFDIPNASLTRLIEMLLTKTTIPRIRVSSLQPQVIGPDLIELWNDSRMCPHFHIPLQSGSNAILERMGRRYTTNIFIRSTEIIRASIAGASITTDVIVGFPGEGDREFQETHRTCLDVGFADMHIFPYSVRPGTSAAHFADHVDPTTKNRRGKLLLHLAKTLTDEFRDCLLGQVRPVLWEGTGTGIFAGKWSGLTDNYVRVYTKDPRDLANTITDTKLLQNRHGVIYGHAE